MTPAARDLFTYFGVRQDVVPTLKEKVMRYKTEVTLRIVDAETGEEFAEFYSKWASMSLASVVGVEKVLHAAQGELIAWSEAEVAK